MNVVFISNYFTHHQQPFCDAISKNPNVKFNFIETIKMEQERIEQMWGLKHIPNYVVQAYKEDVSQYTQTIVEDADVIIIGSASTNWLNKLSSKKRVIIICTERIYKKKRAWYKFPAHAIKLRKKYKRINNNGYLFCSGAYVAKDFTQYGLFKNRCYKWGYFPQTIAYDIDNLIKNKKKNSIIWVARFIDWKHPEIAVEIAKKLKNDGYNFELSMIGNGEKFEEINQMVSTLGLEENVHLLGTMKPEEVRKYMEKSEIHLFTSDRQEGWGAVLNEAMNSACVSVANENIGSVPFLIEDGVNGFNYDGTVEHLYKKIKVLFDDKNKIEKLSRNAYYTILNEWNAERAAEKSVALFESFLKAEKPTELFKSGVGSAI